MKSLMRFSSSPKVLLKGQGNLRRLSIEDRFIDTPMNDAWIAGPLGGQANQSLLSDADDEVHALRIAFKEFLASVGLGTSSPEA